MRGAVWLVLVGACGRLHFDDQVDATPNSGANRIFVSSTRLTGDLGGLSGADATCQGLADGAGLGGEFVALLWDTILQPPSPRIAGSRGWVSTTGRPIADLPTDFDAQASTLDPIQDDENGNRVHDLVWRGNIGSCDGWTSTGGAIAEITRSWSTMGWYEATSLPCGSQARIICAERGRNVPVVPIATSGRIAFVTNEVFTVGGGLASADQMCANQATAAGLPGTYRAWLGSSAGGPETRFGAGEPWRRVDGVRLAETAEQFLSTDDTAFLDSFLNRTASGEFWIGDKVWTGTGGAHCLDWTSTGATGTMANPGSTLVGEFRAEFPYTCIFQMELVCLQL